MLHTKIKSDSAFSQRSVTRATDVPREPTRLPFRSKVLPVIVAASLGFAGVGFFAFRDIARAQTASDMVRSTNSAKSAVANRSRDLSGKTFEAQIAANMRDSFSEGRNTFRFDTFGDEDFWGGMLQLHQAIEGAGFGGIGPGITPRMALDLGLKVDADALHGIQGQLQSGRLD